MAVGCRHSLIAQALLGASVVVVCRLFVRGVALVPASQVFCHQSLLDVLANLLVAAGRWAVVPRRSQCGIWVLRHPVHFVVTVVTVRFVAGVSCWGWVVGRIDVIVPLHLIVVHVDSIRVRLWICVAWVARDVIGSRGGSGPRLVGIATSVWLSQVGHAACVGVHVLSVAAASSASVVAGDAVLYTRLACVGGAVIEDLGAVAAPGCGKDQCWRRGLGPCQELGLGF